MPTRTLTILMADLVGSSAHLTTIPQDQAADYLHDATLPIQQQIEAHEGKVVKFTGDGYLAVFESVGQALRAAEHIRHHFMRQRHTPGGIALDGVRIIINTADVTVQDDDDIVGDGVALVARLEKTVPTNQIYVTQAVRIIADDAEFAFESAGSTHPRGWRAPISLYQLVSTEASFIDPGVFLLITDLHGLIPLGEPLSASEMNLWMEAWGDLHREALAGLRGRVRQFVADMVLATFTNADDAVQAVLNLRALAAHHNKSRTNLPPVNFKAAVSRGDLILSPTGVVGKLVNQTFNLLNATPRGKIVLAPDVFEHLEAYKARFAESTLTHKDGVTPCPAYQLIENNHTPIKQ